MRDFKGIWIPKEIYLDKNLSWSEKILFVEIDSLDNGEGCFASNEHFADFLNVSVTRISKMISKLKDLGFICQSAFNGRQRILKSTFSYVKAALNKSSRQDETKVQVCFEEKFKGAIPDTADTPTDNTPKKTSNNTINNTTNNNNNNNNKGFNDILNTYTQDKKLKQTIFEFIKMRKAIKKPLTDRALQLILSKLNTLTADDNTKIGILEQSIMNSWQSVFPLKQEPQEERPNQRPNAGAYEEV